MDWWWLGLTWHLLRGPSSVVPVLSERLLLFSPVLCHLQYVWDRMLGGFKHKNFRTREGTCLCLVATLNA